MPEYGQQSAEYNARNAAAQFAVSNKLAGGSVPTEASISQAMSEQDRAISQLWQIIHAVGERLQNVSRPDQTLGKATDASAPRPVPSRLIERIGLNNGVLQTQAEMLSQILDRIEL